MNHLVRTQKNMNAARTQAGKVGYLLLWLLGVPIPLLLLFFVLRGCT